MTTVHSEASKPTRAHALRDKVVIRLAIDETGPMIAAVLKENGIEIPGMDWSKVFPHWLIATVENDVVGCVQVLPAKPVGYLEFLFVKKSSPFKVRAIALDKLLIQGFSTLHLAGCQFVGGIVEKSNVKFADVLERRSFVKVSSADIYLKSLK